MRPEPKIVGYSKTADFNGQVGYLLWEVSAHRGARPCGMCEEDVPARLWKTPIPDFLRLMLK